MTTNLNLIWAISDVFNGFLVIPNLIGRLFLSGVVVAETKRFELELKKKGVLCRLIRNPPDMRRVIP